MSVAGLLAALVLVVAVALWVGLPLLRRDDTGGELLAGSQQRQRERLQIYYARVLRNLHDLDEDYSTGKLNPEDYAAQRETWVQRGAAVLQALDDLTLEPRVAAAGADDISTDEALDAAIDSAIEQAVSARRQSVG